MKTIKDFLADKGIEMEDFQNKSADEQAQLYNELNEINRKAYNDLLEKVNKGATKEDLEKMAKDLAKIRDEQFKQLNETLRLQGLAIKNQKDVKDGDISLTNKDLKSQLVEKSDDLKSLKNGETKSVILKVAGDMSLGGNTTGQIPQAQREVGLGRFARRKVFMRDLINNSTATSNIIEWVDQQNADGSAGGTAEGTLKNQIDFDFVVKFERVKKRTAYLRITTEMLDDVEYIYSEINNELMTRLELDIDDQILNGDNLGENFNGIATQAQAFIAGTFALNVPTPNLVDVLAINANNIEVSNHTPTVHVVHPTDLTKLRLEKGINGQYIGRLQTVAGVLSLDGVPIVSNTGIAQGFALTMASDKATLFSKGEIKIEIGLNNDDLTKNYRTVVVEYRGAVRIKTNDLTAFVYSDVAAAITAITKP